MDAVVNEEEDEINVKIEEEDEYQDVIPCAFESKLELIDKKDVKIVENDDEYQNGISNEYKDYDDVELPSCFDVKKEVKIEVNDNEYQHIIPHEYRDYMEQNIGEEQSISTKTTRKKSAKCQKCYKILTADTFSLAQSHALVHMNLKRYKCEHCGHGSWSRSNVQKHIDLQHKNKSYSVIKIQLSLEQQLEFRKIARECFPELAEVTRKVVTINGKRFNSDDTPFEEDLVNEESRKVTDQCQKCKKFIAVSCFASAKMHAVTHTNLKRFKCEQCNYKSWDRFDMQRHVDCQHKNMPCSIQETQLSEEEQLELKKLTRECFPRLANVTRRITTVNRKRFNNDDTHFEEKAADKESRKYQCQKCHKFVILGCFGHAKSHAVSHTSLKRFKCERCSYGAWSRCNVQIHSNRQHKNEPCSVQEVQISEEEQVELNKLTEECFPNVTEVLKRMVDEEEVKVEEEHSTISRKRQRTSDAD